MRYNAMRRFQDFQDAKKFAMEVNSDSWGMETSPETGEIVNWYVDYNDPDWM